MPVISRFFGIVIAMFFDDHPPPHFHAKYQEFDAQIDIQNGKVISGSLPKTALKLVEEWRIMHVDELMANWKKAENLGTPDKIEPLE